MAGIGQDIERLEALAALLEQTGPDEVETWANLIARRQHLIEAVCAAAGPSLDGPTRARIAAVAQRGRCHIEQLEAARAALHEQVRDLYRDNVLIRAYLG